MLLRALLAFVALPGMVACAIPLPLIAPEGSRALWYFTAVIAVAFPLRVLLYEEPRLTELFGEEWWTYTRAVQRGSG